MFTPDRRSIEDILNSSTQFAIPLYQRNYKWGTLHATDFMDDLTNSQHSGNTNDKLFLGTFIFETKDGKTFVVDGQQRLTTILLLLVACRRRALELKNHALASMIQQKITFVDAAKGVSKGSRLIASESVRDVFEFITRDSWDGVFPSRIEKKPVKWQTNRLRPIYDFFFGELTKLDQEGLGQFLRAVYDSFVIRIDITSEIDALSIFERTNARGMELEISDLLKNYLFAKKVQKIEDFWDKIVDNSGGTILRMLKQFYISKKGYVLKPQLYRKLKDYSDKIGPQQLTHQLVDFSRFFHVARTATDSTTQAFFHDKDCHEISANKERYQKINRALEALNEFGVVQFYPPAFAAIECLIRNGGLTKPGDAKALIRLFETLENYHFINNAVCERVGNEVEKLYADICGTYADSKDFIQTTDLFINQLRARLAKEDEFVVNFTDINYSPDQLGLLAYIFDRFNNSELHPGQYVRIYDPNPKVVKQTHNIEHFFPQTPPAGWKGKKDDLEFVDNIGNLLAISFRTNSHLHNDSPEKKIERLKGELQKQIQNLPYVNDFIEKYGPDAATWDKTKVQQRAKDMALKAYRDVWKIK